MNSIVEHFRLNMTATARDYIKDVAPIAHKSPEEAEELIAAARKAIDTAIELLEEWKKLGGERAYGLSCGRSCIIDPPGDHPQYMGLTLCFHLWPFGTIQNGAKVPESVNYGAYLHPYNFTAEQYNAIVNDTLESIKKAEELIAKANKKED